MRLIRRVTNATDRQTAALGGVSSSMWQSRSPFFEVSEEKDLCHMTDEVCSTACSPAVSDYCMVGGQKGVLHFRERMCDLEDMGEVGRKDTLVNMHPSYGASHR